MNAKSHLVAAVVSVLIAVIAAGVALYCAWYRDTARIMGEAVDLEGIERARSYATYCTSFAGFAFIVALGFFAAVSQLAAQSSEQHMSSSHQRPNRKG